MDKKPNIKVAGKRINKLKVDWEEINDFLKLAAELSPKNRFIPKGFINSSLMKKGING